jgi:alginate O-acetyltransferase complex protein AlgI
MLFNSAVFLFSFLPIVLLGFYLLGACRMRRASVGWLVVASLFFYGWWKLSYLWILLFSVGLNYLLGRPLACLANTRKGKLLLAFGVAMNLGLLGYYKYTGFLLGNINAVFDVGWTVPAILLPIGISFFTFQQIAFLVDTYQGKTTEFRFFDYALFVTFFPQLIAGPIVHHKEMMPQFSRQETGTFRSFNLSIGMTIFIIGLFKKVIIADHAALLATPIFDNAEQGIVIGMAAAWEAALAYTVQIYFDFSGYSDMAIGLGRMFGIILPINFDSPYKARNIIDFWRRWHITLSRFLRDYLYFPLGGNRRGEVRRYINVMIVMLLGGLWHGAGWTLVIWGGLHGLYLAINHAWQRICPMVLESNKSWWGHGVRLGSWGLTLIAVILAWVFFRAPTLQGALAVFHGMVGLNGLRGGGFERDGVFLSVLLPLLLAMFAPNTQQILRAYRPGLGHRERPDLPSVPWLSWRPNLAYATLWAVIALFSISHLWSTSEFLYFQF